MHLSPIEKVVGTIERITFRSEDSGFCVLRVKAQGHRDLVTVTGQAAAVQAGEYLQATGNWHHDRQYGRQFKATHLELVLPTTLAGIEKYLASGLIKGIGAHFAKKLVTAFGEEVLDVIENSPEVLGKVAGIGKKRSAQIIASWAAQKSIRQIMIFLQSHGVGTARAVRIYKTYGDAAIQKVTDNPYTLAQDIHGIGFKTADMLAQRLGIGTESLIRARAGINHVLKTLCSNEGHCAIADKVLTATAVELLAIPEEIIQQATGIEIASQNLIVDQQTDAVYVAPAPLYHAEQGIAKQLYRLAKEPVAWANNPLMISLLTTIEQERNMEFSPAQRAAIICALQTKIMVLTGGPGVGKTTIIYSIVHILNSSGVRISLCAPTGRAARRLAESCAMPAQTIHRLLEFSPITQQFRYNQQCSLPIDLLVVDEASMVDVVLMNQLLKALPSSAALLIVGDADQLPSVGSGAVLKDLINSDMITKFCLTKIFRQAATSQIITNAHRINKGYFPEQSENPNTDFYFIATETPEEAYDKLLHLVVERVPKAFNVDPCADIQVLSPMQRGTLGVRTLNVELQARLNGNAITKIVRFGTTFSSNDKVMQIINNYDKDVFNGDIGRITYINNEEQTLDVCFDERTVVYDFDELDELVLAYAVTIHKSQGSEYPVVIIPLTTQHYTMLQRNLIYTAVTRGKRLVIVVGQKKALAMAVNNNPSLKRITFLPKLLAKNFE